MNREDLLSLEEVLAVLPCSRNTFYNWRERGIFPAPIRLGGRRLFWLKADVTKWYKTKVEGRSEKENDASPLPDLLNHESAKLGFRIAKFLDEGQVKFARELSAKISGEVREALTKKYSPGETILMNSLIFCSIYGGVYTNSVLRGLLDTLDELEKEQ